MKIKFHPKVSDLSSQNGYRPEKSLHSSCWDDTLFSSDTPYKGSGVMDLAIVSLHSWLASCAAISPGIANPRPTARPAVSGNIVTLHSSGQFILQPHVVSLHSWPPQPNDRPGRRPIVTLHSWQPGRLTPPPHPASRTDRSGAGRAKPPLPDLNRVSS